MFQTILTLLIAFAIAIPVGRYLYIIVNGKKTFPDRFFNPIENFIFRICGIKNREMGWKQYFVAILVTNIFIMILGFVLLQITALPIFNPNSVGRMDFWTSFNTVISFMTNTNLQHYTGETSLSYMGQMSVIVLMMFASAATGLAAFSAFLRGICNKESMGNFYKDFTRIITRVLLPFSIIVCALLVWQGVPQNLSPNVSVQTVEGATQTIYMGPVASLEAIKHVGTNGGGFFGANSSHPFENPNIVSNMIEIFSMMVLPIACIIAFGLTVFNKKKKNVVLGGEGRTILIAVGLIFIVSLLVTQFAENMGNPALENIGLSQSMGSMEGKETRFGTEQSSLFTTVTTAFSTGSVNNMHDSLTPLGGMMAMINMMLNTVFGGNGVGFMNIIMYVLLAVFLCGLMIGKTPEYLGKKIENKEMKLVVIFIIIQPLLILGFTALATGIGGVGTQGFHGFSQMLYEFTSSAANNGSGFEGLKDNTIFWNVTTGIVMFIGRYATIGLQLALAGSLMKKQTVNETVGTLKTDNFSFAIIVAVIMLIFSALTFFPVLSLGPIAEQLTLWR